MAAEAVTKYLVDTNRPYSCADVTVNLRGAYSKTVVQKALDALSEAGKIKCKLYGKQKVYAAIQPDGVADESDVKDYDTELKKLTCDLAEKANALKVVEMNLKSLISAPTTDSAKSKIEEIKKRTEALQKRLETLKASTDILTPEEKNKIYNEHETILREYRKRKRVCNDMLDAILEGYPKSKKTLLEELCLETDEMVDFMLMTN